MYCILIANPVIQSSTQLVSDNLDPDAKLPVDEKSKAASSIACPITSDIVAVEAQLLFQYVDPILKVQDHCRIDQGLLYRWTEHLADLFFSISTGGGPPNYTPWVDFLDHDLS